MGMNRLRHILERGLRPPLSAAGRNIELSIDDAPGESNAEMRGLLAEYGIKTTFFIEGAFAQARPEDVQAILADGHSIGNHTWDHPDLTKLSDDQIKDELTRTDALIQSLTGKSMAPHWRPPYGAINRRVRAAAAAAGFTRPWLWDLNSSDWMYGEASDRILYQVRGGLQRCGKPSCHILFHDLNTTVAALRIFIDQCRAEGTRILDFTPQISIAD
jgi:peptidoglycan/xylan/chitin deacetylase (PgdA/CDA1 family)